LAPPLLSQSAEVTALAGGSSQTESRAALMVAVGVLFPLRYQKLLTQH